MKKTNVEKQKKSWKKNTLEDENEHVKQQIIKQEKKGSRCRRRRKAEAT